MPNNPPATRLTRRLIETFPSGYPTHSFFNYVANLVPMEHFIAVAGLLAPEITEADGHIFLSENYPMLNGHLSTRFGNDRKTVERYVNLFCLSDFYLLAADDMSANTRWQLQQGEIIREYWSRHVHRLYPGKAFDFELTAGGLLDEDGVCLTFSQR